MHLLILNSNRKFLVPILACLTALVSSAGAYAQQNKADDLIVEMGQAFKRSDKKRLSSLLPQVKGHVLEPQAAYWEIKARLDEASGQEVQETMQRYADSYHEDRLRNDWLLLLGQRRDWASFALQYPKYRMHDDKEVRCYALWIEATQKNQDVKDEVRRHWLGMRDADDGCTLVAEHLVRENKLGAGDVWRKARLGMENNRPRTATNAVRIVAPDFAAQSLRVNPG